MILKIERVADIRKRTREPAFEKQHSVLNVRIQRQKLTKWCWAAIASSLEDYYYGKNSWQQEEISSHLLGFDCSKFEQDESIAIRCNQYALLDEALKLVGCYSHWSPGRPPFERIQEEIDKKKPICVRIEWFNGGFHYLVIIGYYNETGEIYIEDPLHGPSVQFFDKFPSSYRGTGGIWRETFWTCSP